MIWRLGFLSHVRGIVLKGLSFFFAFKIFLLFSRLNKRFLWKTLVVEEDHLRQVSFKNNICAHTFFQISRWWCGWHIFMIIGFLTFWGSCSFIFCLSRRSQKISDSCWQRFAHYLYIFLMIWRIKQRCLMYVNFLFQLVSSFCLRKTSKLDHRKLETIFDSIRKHDNQRLRYNKIPVWKRSFF